MKDILNWGRFEGDKMLEKVLLRCEFICPHSQPLTISSKPDPRNRGIEMCQVPPHNMSRVRHL